MKRIINGEWYDSELSTLISEAIYGDPTDKDHYSEALYRNVNEVFFLAALGGVDSYYASLFSGGNLTPGSDIIPLTSSEARRWLEDHDYQEKIERLFGKQSEAGHDTECIDLRVPTELKKRIEVVAAEEGVSMEIWLIKMIKRELD